MQVYLNCVQFYASSENVSLLPLVVRLNSVKTSS
jgi:gamma-tubulin complex component 2